MKKIHYILIIAALLIVTGVIGRFIDHPPNFAPIAAIALVSGYYLKSKWGFVIPLAAMLVADVFIGFYAWQVMLAVYASYLAVWAMARFVKNKSGLIPTVLFGSLLFFVVTNFAVWAFTAMYTKDLAGLMQSYYMAIPFFKWTLLSDIFYASIMVGVLETSSHFAKVKSAKLVHNS